MTGAASHVRLKEKERRGRSLSIGSFVEVRWWIVPYLLSGLSTSPRGHCLFETSSLFVSGSLSWCPLCGCVLQSYFSLPFSPSAGVLIGLTCFFSRYKGKQKYWHNDTFWVNNVFTYVNVCQYFWRPSAVVPGCRCFSWYVRPLAGLHRGVRSLRPWRNYVHHSQWSRSHRSRVHLYSAIPHSHTPTVNNPSIR